MKNLTFILFFICWTFAAMAQPAADINLKKINKQLDNIEKSLNIGNVDAAVVSTDLKTVNNIQNELNQLKTSYNEKLQSVQKKLGALGEVPENGAKEPADIAENRKNFTAEEEKYKSQIAQIELLTAKIDDINSLILKVRNQSLLNRILVRQTSVYQIKDFSYSLWKFLIFVSDIIKSPHIWFNGLTPEQQQVVKDHTLSVGGIIALALIVSVYLSLLIRRRFGYGECSVNPPFSAKLQSAAAMAVSFGVIPATTLGVFILWMQNSQLVMSANPGRLLYLAALYLLYFALIRAAVRVIFVPNCGNWRIININDTKAKSLSRTIIFSAIVILTTMALRRFATETNAEEDVLYALQILGIAAKAFAIILVTRNFLTVPAENKDPITEEENAQLAFAAKTNLFVTLFTGLVFTISLFGYVRLSEFIIDRFILSVLIVGGFWLADKIIRILLHRILLLKFWKKNLRLSPKFLIKTEFWIGIFLTPLVWAIGIIAILGIWGFSVDIMLHDIKNFLLGFDIGGMHISIISVVTGLAAFFISMFIFKGLKGSIQTGRLSKIDMEEDSRNSLAAGIGLIGFIVSIMVAFAVMGGSLSSIALIAGALSFGVGLGLQNIVSNFVSGIIIIFERPIKIGDWVIINGQEGIVKTISMRSTLLEAFNKSDIIIPNSIILNGSLINMTYSNRIGRIDIKINANYGINFQALQKRLIEIAVATAGVLSNPEPSVALSEFTDNTMNLQLHCFTANVFARQSIANQLREAIITEFMGTGIIPAFKKSVQIVPPPAIDHKNNPTT